MTDGERAEPLADKPLAVIDDPWAAPLPEHASYLATVACEVSPAWRIPSVFGRPGTQGWNPSRPPWTLGEYETVAVQRGHTRPTVDHPSLWFGFGVAARRDVRHLVGEGWPPREGRAVLVPQARVFRYSDPADHDRTELLPFIPSTARTIVDVGCGGGRFGRLLRCPGRTVIGIEPDWPMARQAARCCDMVIPARAEDALKAIRAPIDCFVFADVLEHTIDPAAVLEMAGSRLAARGRIVVAMPNLAWAPILRALAGGRFDYTLAGVQARDHLFFATEASFCRLAAECGLTVERIVPLCAPSDWRDRLWGWLAARLAGGQPSALRAPQFVADLRRT